MGVAERDLYMSETEFYSSVNDEECGVIWSSEYKFAGDALELSGDEGRGKLRKATGRSKHP